MSRRTAIYDLHVAHHAKMVEFAGYSMPIQYDEGVIKEHEWVRSNAGIFDVSHMGQILIEGDQAAEFCSYITPSTFMKTPVGRAKYTVLTNEEGGIIDDLIITKLSDNRFFAVINAACKEKDMKWIEQHLREGVRLSPLDNRSLIAIQGPKSEAVLSQVLENVDLKEQAYMSLEEAYFQGNDVYVSRLGYTGEDGFEVSVLADDAPALWEALLAHQEVKEIGLGARDTLRLEMGYPLYGHDINAETSPIDADLGWIVAKNHDDFIGASRILKEKIEGTARKRVGIKILGRGIAREGAEIYSTEGEPIGEVTSGGFSPSLGQAIGQGYVDQAFAEKGTDIVVLVRKKEMKAVVALLPFVEPQTKSIKKK